MSLGIKSANGNSDSGSTEREWKDDWLHVNLPMILENDARVLNGACGVSSMPLNSWMRFSASRSKLFKWLPSESGDLTGIGLPYHANVFERSAQYPCKRSQKQRDQKKMNNIEYGCIQLELNQSGKAKYIHLFPSTAPCCSSIFVSERLLLRTATVSGDSPSVFKLHSKEFSFDLFHAFKLKR